MKSDIEPATSTNSIILLDKRVWWAVAGTMPTAPFYLLQYVKFQDCSNCTRIFFIKLRGKQGSLNLASQVQVGGIIYNSIYNPYCNNVISFRGSISCQVQEFWAVPGKPKPALPHLTLVIVYSTTPTHLYTGLAL